MAVLLRPHHNKDGAAACNNDKTPPSLVASCVKWVAIDGVMNLNKKGHVRQKSKKINVASAVVRELIENKLRVLPRDAASLKLVVHIVAIHDAHLAIVEDVE